MVIALCVLTLGLLGLASVNSYLCIRTKSNDKAVEAHVLHALHCFNEGGTVGSNFALRLNAPNEGDVLLNKDKELWDEAAVESDEMINLSELDTGN